MTSAAAPDADQNEYRNPFVRDVLPRDLRVDPEAQIPELLADPRAQGGRETEPGQRRHRDPAPGERDQGRGPPFCRARS